MGKLNQVIAVVVSKKKRAQEVLTQIYHLFQKPELFTGLQRRYQPKEEEGERLPEESKLVQQRVDDLLRQACQAWVEMMDTVATQDCANCEARADIRVGDQTILTQVPVTHLLFLEKQLVDFATFVGKIPTLDPGEQWLDSQSTGGYATPPVETVRTKKVPRAFIKYEATEHHPAQVDSYMEDILAGTWRTVKLSGALPASRKQEMAERVRLLQEAVARAREQANLMEAPAKQTGKAVLQFIFGPKLV